MTRFVAIYTKAGRYYAQGPYPSRQAAATDAAIAKSQDFDLGVEVAPILNRPVEYGHVPLGVDADGNGPVPDGQADHYVCLECGCPAVARPTAEDGDAIDRLTEDLRRAQSELPALRKRLHTD